MVGRRGFLVQRQSRVWPNRDRSQIYYWARHFGNSVEARFYNRDIFAKGRSESGRVARNVVKPLINRMAEALRDIDKAAV